MKKYLIEMLHNGVTISVVYNESGKLIAFSIEGDLTDDFYNWLMLRVPLKISDLIPTFKPIKTARISEIPEDLSFERFWDAYDLKVSNKKRTEAKWKKMPDTERQKALNHLKVYDCHLFENPTQNKKHAETYLNSEMWNN